MDMEYEIQNVVVRVTYEDSEFDLNRLANLLEETRYDPDIFPGVAYKPSGKEASFLIFSSGKMNCVGAKSIEGAEEAIRELTERIRGVEIGPDVEPNIEVQNIVASLDFERGFDVERIADTFRNVEYEPEVFPGLVFRLSDPSATLLLFPSGKGVCAGVKSEEDIEKAAERVTEVVK
ncbi:hypothetical protein AKJ62_00865 [candidate division MSBL1 archaeon SCGC-AAA259D14]|uniref:TATA-box-binding protein n=1 Tax=candidate division MSBL1 archaeon SCGC-AAA259D14 TaxID=1698261 RepID=A0A133U8L0_9EURY|nr:hypothetical protein AKJ62_00865 [candidate division MSBL1 archaeon SCGC-AAA259D14]